MSQGLAVAAARPGSRWCRRKFWLALPLVAACAPWAGVPGPALTAAECGQASRIDVLDHDVELSISLAPPALSGHGSLRLRAREATSVALLDARELTVAEVTVDGARAESRADAQHLCVRLPRALRAGEETTLALRWDARVDRDTPHFSASEVWAGYSTQAWMPTVLDAAQRATLTLRLRVPEGLLVAASGKRGEVSQAAGGRRTHVFTVAQPVAPFLFAFAAGDFDETILQVGGVALRGLGPRGVTLDEALAVTAEALRFLEARTGVAYPREVYTQVFVDGDAAQESAGLALLSASAIAGLRADPKDDWLFSHELSHQWFAVLVGCADFSDFWLNEGFATFLVGAFKEQREGRPAHDAEVAVWKQRSAKAHLQGRDAPVSLWPLHRHVTEGQLQARGVTYFRGALVLDRLRALLGDEAFWAGVRVYTQRQAGRGATSESLRAAFEQASGRELQAFFQRWVYASATDWD